MYGSEIEEKIEGRKILGIDFKEIDVHKRGDKPLYPFPYQKQSENCDATSIKPEQPASK
ncbi:hypothetical protein DPMN_079275 [Dreissena polymorpha]|uniref:Uncharacterized protein n=1 Tax=Dreissena polymorpha TaxID=45954 RepID=A0A9D4BR32_DREPO|nr:hypothetical protein DPMN_079217 [Dreissena polymorpha]KAH3704219.1 hypothetical protein DPMN_079275 [Dreissena polymorpha]